jgi:hypothetical protein
MVNTGKQEFILEKINSRLTEVNEVKGRGG